MPCFQLPAVVTRDLAVHLNAGATVYPAERATPFERFFFREPINGYVIEVIDSAREGLIAEK
jgi:hypothetical protein